MSCSGRSRRRPTRRGLAPGLGCALAAAWLAVGAPARSQEPPPAPPEQPAEPSAPEPRRPPEAAGDEPLEVVIHGAVATPVESHRDPAAAVLVLPAETLHEPGLTAAEALARVPGVQISRSGAGSDLATAAIRGASSAQTPIYLAGVRLNDDLTGTVDLSTVPLWMLQRAEIYRGHAPLDSDRLGLGGAIALYPLLPSGGPHGYLGAGVGSFGERDLRGSLSLGDGDAGALLGLRLHHAENDYLYVDDRGTVFDESDDRQLRRHNGDAQSFDLWAIGRLRVGSSGSLVTTCNAFGREGGAASLSLISSRLARFQLRRWLAGLAGRLPCGKALGFLPGCELQLGSSVLLAERRLSDPVRELSSARQVSNTGERFAQQLHLQASPLPWLALRLGGSYESQHLEVVSDGAYTARAHRQMSRAVASGQARFLERLDVVAVAALQCHTTESGGRGETCGVLAPEGRLGARLEVIPPLAIYANAGRYLRPPTLAELYGISAMVRGNAELLEETGLSVDVGLRAVTPDAEPVGAYGQLFGFLRFANDLIAYRRSSLGVIRPYNTDEARFLGLEIAAGLTLFKTVSAAVAVAALDPRDISPERTVVNDLLPFQSRLTVAPELALQTPAGWPRLGLDQARISLRYHYRSSRPADPAGLITLAEQSDLDIDLSLKLLAGKLWLRGRVANLLDRPSFDQVGYPLPGRAVHVRTEAWF